MNTYKMSQEVVMKIREIKSTGQMILSVPKESGFEVGDWIQLIPIKLKKRSDNKEIK